MAYQPRPETLQSASEYLQANPGKKVMPVDLVSATLGIDSAKRVCKYMHDKGLVIRLGRGYTWNVQGSPVIGPMTPIYIERVLKLTGLVVEEIRQRKLHNQLIGRDYFAGRSYSPLYGRKQILSLQESLLNLKHLRGHLDWLLLLVVEHEMCLDMPDWAGKAYRRTQEDEAMLEAWETEKAMERRMHANRKPMTAEKRAEIAARRDAYLAERQAQKAAADAAKAARLVTLFQQIDAAHGPEALILANQIDTLAPEVVEGLVNEMHHHIPPEW